MSADSKNLLKKIESGVFDDYFEQNIKPHLSDAESERVVANKVWKRRFKFFGPFFVFGFIIAALCELDGDVLLYRFLPEVWANSIMIFSALILISSILLFEWYNCKYFCKRNAVSKLIYDKVLAFAGDFSHNFRSSLFLKKDEIKSFIENLYLFGKINDFGCDDSIHGRFQGKELDVCEINFASYDMLKDLMRKEYRGVFIYSETDINLVSGFTITKKTSGKKTKLKKDVINLDSGNAVFDKLFDIYTVNISETKKVLTREFIQTFLNVYFELGLSLSCAYKENKLYVLILNDEKHSRDWFSFETEDESYLDNKTFKGILKDFSAVLQVVEGLRQISKRILV